MTRKYNCPHPDRGRSNYQRRLERRGLSKSPVMHALDWLRAKQTREAKDDQEDR